MTPDDLAKANGEHSHQRALFHWANMASEYGFRIADNPTSYASKEAAEALQLAIGYGYEGSIDTISLMFAIPNGGKRDKITASKLKAEGVKPGVPDIFLPVSSGDCCGLFIEMKDPARRNHRNGGLSDLQLIYFERLARAGYKCVSAYTWRDAADHIKRYYGY